MLSGLPAGNVHVSWVSVSTSNMTQKGEIQHLKRLNEEIVRYNFLFVFCLFSIKFVPHESVPMMIFQQNSTTFENTHNIVNQRLQETTKLHLLWEGIARLTEQVNIPLQNSASHNSHLLFPHSHS